MSAKQLDFYDTYPIKIAKNGRLKSKFIKDSKKEIKDGYSLVCDVDATHSGTLINNRIYPPKAMRRGIKSWTNPYKKPVLVNHDEYEDPIGRVISAKYVKTPMAKDSDDYSPILEESEGYGYQRLTLKVTDAEAIQKVLDGRYETVSVRMSTNHAVCSICNRDWSGEDGPCEHMPGGTYEDKLAYITTGDLTYKEVSFVNIPADEYAGVGEAVVSEGKDALEFNLYANNDSERVLQDMKTGANLYEILDSENIQEDEIVSYLLDKSNKSTTINDNEEEDVNLTDLTKDQLVNLEVVKELVKEAVDAAVVESDKKCEDAKKACKDSLDVASKELEDLKKFKEAADLKEKEMADKAKLEEEEKAKAGSGASDNVQAGAEEIKALQDENKKILDENVRINAELHKMIAERLYDLKVSLRKPDVAGVTTPDARGTKIEEFSQRSVDSLKDQIKDLLIEQSNVRITGTDGKQVINPSISRSDVTNEVMEDKKKVKEGKHDTLTRLFPKSK